METRLGIILFTDTYPWQIYAVCIPYGKIHCKTKVNHFPLRTTHTNFCGGQWSGNVKARWRPWLSIPTQLYARPSAWVSVPPHSPMHPHTVYLSAYYRHLHRPTHAAGAWLWLCVCVCVQWGIDRLTRPHHTDKQCLAETTHPSSPYLNICIVPCLCQISRSESWGHSGHALPKL